MLRKESPLSPYPPPPPHKPTHTSLHTHRHTHTHINLHPQRLCVCAARSQVPAQADVGNKQVAHADHTRHDHHGEAQPVVQRIHCYNTCYQLNNRTHLSWSVQRIQGYNAIYISHTSNVNTSRSDVLSHMLYVTKQTCNQCHGQPQPVDHRTTRVIYHMWSIHVVIIMLYIT